MAFLLARRQDVISGQGHAMGKRSRYPTSLSLPVVVGPDACFFYPVWGSGLEGAPTPRRLDSFSLAHAWTGHVHDGLQPFMKCSTTGVDTVAAARLVRARAPLPGLERLPRRLTQAGRSAST
jgi:hypothetical protein